VVVVVVAAVAVVVVVVVAAVLVVVAAAAVHHKLAKHQAGSWSHGHPRVIGHGAPHERPPRPPPLARNVPLLLPALAFGVGPALCALLLRWANRTP
jgi:hypothetical protein